MEPSQDYSEIMASVQEKIYLSKVQSLYTHTHTHTVLHVYTYILNVLHVFYSGLLDCNRVSRRVSCGYL